MSGLRVLGFCYLALASAFALAIATADQTRLRDAMDTASQAISDRAGPSVLQPLLGFARALDEQLFDPPRKIASITVAPPGPQMPEGLPPSQPNPPRLAAMAPLAISPDLSEIEAQARTANGDPAPDKDNSGSTTGALVQARLGQSLTPELRSNFDLFLFVGKAAHGPAAQRLYVFQKTSQGALALVHDWAASTGREKYEVSSRGDRAFTATPPGFYQFDPNRMYRQYISRAWNGEMPYAMFFSREWEGIKSGVAIHAATGNGILQLGRRASAGCIHLSPEHAALLYKMIRSDYRGKVPRFAYDQNGRTTSNRGELMRDAAGRLEMSDGYRVLIDVDDFAGNDVVATLY